MYPRYKLSYPPTLLSAVKNIPTRAKQDYKRELMRTVKPEVQQQVDDLLGQPAPPVKLPFEFATEKSRRAYFATNAFGKGIPYRRTNQLPTSWRVDLTTRLQKNFIVITNPKSYTKYVYGSIDQRQVPGHRNTGWGKDFDTAIELINEDAIILIKNTWRDVVLKVVRTR